MAAGIRYAFDAFELDPQTRRLTRVGDAVQLAERHFEVLHQLVSHAGETVSKDTLVAAAWCDVAVTDNSLEQAISALRRALGAAPDGSPYIATVPRRGYRFNGRVTRSATRASDASLDALLAPHRAWLEGRAALETLDRGRIAHAREVFADVVHSVPEHPLAHIGLANACAMQFETTRADRQPDTGALAIAVHHAHEACRLDAQSGEAWATLGFVLDRSGLHDDAVAALRMAASLEPDSWRHHFRLAYASWGEQRLRAARRTLVLLPGFALAHWMVATVQVARNVLDQARQELEAGITCQQQQGAHTPFSAVGLNWLLGLVHLAQGAEGPALDAFRRELACEATNHLYARECCANTWYAIGALHLRHGRSGDAREAFHQALDRVAVHPLARIALAAITGAPASIPGGGDPATSVDTAIAEAVRMGLSGDHAGAAQLVDRALANAAPGAAGWLLSVEPLLNISARSSLWASALARLRARAS